MISVSCFQIFADFAPGIMTVWFDSDFLHSRYFVVFVGLCLIAPFAFVRNLSYLSPLSAFTLLLNLCLMGILFANLIKASSIGALSHHSDFFVYDWGFYCWAVINAPCGVLSLILCLSEQSIVYVL